MVPRRVYSTCKRQSWWQYMIEPEQRHGVYLVGREQRGEGGGEGVRLSDGRTWSIGAGRWDAFGYSQVRRRQLS